MEITSSRDAGALLTYCIQVPVGSVHSRGGSIEFTISASWPPAAVPGLAFASAPSKPTKSGSSCFSRLAGAVRAGGSSMAAHWVGSAASAPRPPSLFCFVPGQPR